MTSAYQTNIIVSGPNSSQKPQNYIDVTDRIFAATALRFCSRDGESNYYDIWREFSKEKLQVSYQEFDTDNATVKQHGDEALRGFKKYCGKCAVLASTDTGNRTGIDKFYEAISFIPRNLEASASPSRSLALTGM